MKNWTKIEEKLLKTIYKKWWNWPKLSKKPIKITKISVKLKIKVQIVKNRLKIFKIGQKHKKMAEKIIKNWAKLINVNKTIRKIDQTYEKNK